MTASILDAIGNTPLIRLKRASEATGCDILGKAEFMNPGQSVKDRAALYIIRDALKSGRLAPGGTVVEGTAGNTGIGLTMVGTALGLKTVIFDENTGAGGQIYRAIARNGSASRPYLGKDYWRGAGLWEALCASAATYVPAAAVWSLEQRDSEAELRVSVADQTSTVDVGD